MVSVRQAFESLSVVIPAYGAARHIETTLADVLRYLDHSGIVHEVIVVDDGSSDDTAERVQTLGARVRLVRNETNRGKGDAVRRGMLETSMAWALFMDADNATRIAQLERFAPAAAGHDVLIASRRVAGARIVRRQARFRQLLGRSFPYLVRAVALPGIRDSQCGFKLFRRRAVELIFPALRTRGFAFDVEVLLLARQHRLGMAEVPVDWENPAGSTLRVGRDSLRMLFDVTRLAVRYRRRGM